MELVNFQNKITKGLVSTNWGSLFGLFGGLWCLGLSFRLGSRSFVSDFGSFRLALCLFLLFHFRRFFDHLFLLCCLFFMNFGISFVDLGLFCSSLFILRPFVLYILRILLFGWNYLLWCGFHFLGILNNNIFNGFLFRMSFFRLFCIDFFNLLLLFGLWFGLCYFLCFRFWIFLSVLTLFSLHWSFFLFLD